jgi:DNA repair protein RadD
VDYWHGYLVVATEWVCLEHNGFARQKAVTWWQRRSQQPVPLTITAALERTDDLMTPSQIHLIQNGKYQEIKGYEFSRTATTETIIDDCDGDNESAAFSFA